MTQKEIENRSLIVSTLGNFVIGGAGVAIFIVTGLNALFLDGVFSLIALFSSLIAVFISRNSHKQTKTFPQGLFFLEPLYAILKSLATLLLIIITLLETSETAYAYFVHGIGHEMTTGSVLPYTICMVILCFSLGFYNRKQNAKINGVSTMIEAEAKGNFIDGLISAGVGLAMIALKFIAIDGSLGFLHYTGDFFITLFLVIFSIKEPVTVLTTAFKELTNATTSDQDIRESVHEALKPYLGEVQEQVEVYIFKQGMQITVRITILEMEDTELIAYLASHKAELLNRLRQQHEYITVEYVF